MTNAIAIGLGAVIVLAIIVDQLLGLNAGLFAARKLAALIEHVAFWR